jgi:RNA polymerase sigma-70 factor (ECF subfamily)
MSSICHESSPPTPASAAFEDIVVPLLPDMNRTALRFARQRDEARDLTQESLLRALRGFSRFTPGTNARAWLRAIVHSTFLTNDRRRQRQVNTVDRDVEHVSDEGRALALVSPRESARGDAADIETIADPRIRQALDRLPPVFRAAVWLVDIDELSYVEAAAALRCPVNTLKSRLFRARRHLAAALPDYAPTR